MDSYPYHSVLVPTLKKFFTHVPILVVDDSAICRHAAKAQLNCLGYDVDTATNGKQALDLFCNKETRYQLMFLDYGLPDTTGIALAAAICAHENQYYRPAAAKVLCSAHKQTKDMQASMWLSIDYAVNKPIYYADLEQIVQYFLGSRIDDTMLRQDVAPYYC